MGIAGVMALLSKSITEHAASYTLEMHKPSDQPYLADQTNDPQKYCAGGCGKLLEPGDRGPLWCPECFQRITDEGDRVREPSVKYPWW